MLDHASWPARHYAEQGGFEQSGWQYLLVVVVVYALEAVVVAWLWSEFWFCIPDIARRIGKWAARSGSFQSMKSTERALAGFDRACGRLRLLSGITRSRGPEPRDADFAGDGARGLVRLCRFLARGVFGAVGALAKLAKRSVSFMVRPWGLLLLTASVATVYPHAISGALAAFNDLARDVVWTNQFFTNVVTIVGVVVAVGVVVLKGLLSDRISARRHVQEGRNRQALESIAPLSEPFGRIGYFGMNELESACDRVAWQLDLAEDWINGRVGRTLAVDPDEYHLACGSDCPDRYEPNVGAGRVFRSVELDGAFEQIDEICGKLNPLAAWGRELSRVCSYRERFAMVPARYHGESLAEYVRSGLHFISDGEVEKVRIRWQHSCPTDLIEDDPDLSAEYIWAERRKYLDSLAADYRDLTWDTLGRLRFCEEMAEIAWRANGLRGDLFARFAR